MSESLTSMTVGRWGLEYSTYDPYDPAGQLLVWEPPSPYANYIIGADPTGGILGWNRNHRSDEDRKHDNAAIEVVRVGAAEVIERPDGTKVLEKQKDVQVAEWVGPIDAEDFAYICNLIGRMYPGRSEEQQALLCLEIYPGPGWLTQRVLASQYGYERFPAWLVEGKNMQQYDTGKKGWISNASTRRDLWTRCGGHIKRQRVTIRSKWLVEEMVACTPDNFLSMTARAARSGRSGFNDDRVVALMIALWFANEWSLNGEPTEPTGPVASTSAADWQLSAISYEDMIESWNERMSELQD